MSLHISSCDTFFPFYLHTKKSLLNVQQNLPNLKCKGNTPYRVAVAEVQGGDDLSEELSGLFRC